MTIAAATTNFKAATAAFAGDVDAAKVQLANLNNQIATLQSQRMAVENAPPHTEDIVAMFQRGLTDATGAFEQQMQTYLRAEMTGPQAASMTKGKGRDYLSIGSTAVDRDMLRAREGGRPFEGGLAVAAVTYVLRTMIATEMPALVDRLLPSARTGLKAADRAAQVQALTIQINDLRAQAETLNQALVDARAALRNGRG